METGDLTIWDYSEVDGDYTIAASAVNPRSGTYSLRAVRTGTTGAGAFVQLNASAVKYPSPGGSPHDQWIEASSTTGEMWLRCYMYFTVLTDATAARLDLIEILNSTLITKHWSLVMAASGLLRARNAVGTLVSIFTPSTATWYRMVLHIQKTGAATWTYNIKFYNEDTNVIAGSATGTGGTSADWDYIDFGLVAFTAGGGNVDLHFDDIAINDDQASLAKHRKAPAQGAVVGAYVPTANGTVEFGDETGVGGTADFSNIDEWPAGVIDTADYNMNPVGTTAVKDLFTCANYAGTANGVVQAVQVYFYVADGIASDGLGFSGGVQDSNGIVLNASEEWPGSGGGDPETLNKVSIGGTADEMVDAWTNTEFNATQFMYKRTAVPATEFKRIFAVAMEMEDNDAITPISLPHTPPTSRSTLIRR